MLKDGNFEPINYMQAKSSIKPFGAGIIFSILAHPVYKM